MIPAFLNEKIAQYYPNNKEEIIQNFSKKRYTTFRINTLKSTKEEVIQTLKEKGFVTEEVPWYPYALLLKNQSLKQLQELEIYKNGSIYVQSLSSMLPVLLLNPKPNEHILDMTASPGSKTTQIAMQTSNHCCITACEKNPYRLQRLQYNLEKQGVKCCTVLNVDARNLDEFFTFDKILLDAPCSGSGTYEIGMKNPMLTEENLKKIQKVQISLLRKALQILKPHERLVYSTCSIFPFENEEVIEVLQKEFSFKIIPISIPFIELLPTKLEGTMTVKPTEQMEGFFVALLEKEK